MSPIFSKKHVRLLLEVCMLFLFIVIGCTLLNGGISLKWGVLKFESNHLLRPIILLGAALLLNRMMAGAGGAFLCLQPLMKQLERVDAFIARVMRPGRRRWGIAIGYLAFFMLAAITVRYRNGQHGLNGEYYNNDHWAGAPVSVSQDHELNLRRMDAEYPSLLSHYSIRWTGFLAIPASGNYTFSLFSDDGSVLKLNGQVVVDDSGSHGAVEKTATISLRKGIQPITIEYAQYDGGAVCEVYWDGPHFKKEHLPQNDLYPVAPKSFLTWMDRWLSGLYRILKDANYLIVVSAVLIRLNPRRRLSSKLLLTIIALLWLAMGGEAALLRLLNKAPQSGLQEWGRLAFGAIVVCVCLGMDYARCSLKALLQNAALAVVTILLCCGMLEIALRTGWFDDKGILWIQEKYRIINNAINEKNWAYANQNPYGFTDIVRTPEKPAGTTRIAVLGDSFVWGAAIPYEQTWGHKLAKKFAQSAPQLEIMNWGKGGWSTLDEASFIEAEGFKYGVDVLLVGFVRNDPDFANYTWTLIDVKKLPQWYAQAFYWPFRTFFPNVFELTTAYVNEFLMNYVCNDLGYGWNVWYQNIYSKVNLQAYAQLLRDFETYCNEHHIRLIFVLTPASHDVVEGRRMSIIADLLEQNQIEHLNLFPALERDLGHYRPRQLWANLADGHPGPLMTDLFANEVAQYLAAQGVTPPPATIQ